MKLIAKGRFVSSDCIFCRIAAGNAPADVVYSADGITAFRDIHPQAKVHILVIPNEHFDSLNHALQTDPELPGRLIHAAAEVARQAGISDSGYRVATNIGPDGRQSVGHLHFHVLGGERLSPRVA